MNPNHQAVAMVALVLSSSLAVLFLGGLLLFNDERPKSYFETYEELSESGLIEEGWIPEYIPHSISKIFEQHHYNTKRVDMKFRYNDETGSQLEDHCKKQVRQSDATVYLCGWPYDIMIALYDNGRGWLTNSPIEISKIQR